MDILVSRTLYMSCQAGPGIEPGPSALKASALPIELTWQIKALRQHNRQLHQSQQYAIPNQVLLNLRTNLDLIASLVNLTEPVVHGLYVKCLNRIQSKKE